MKLQIKRLTPTAILPRYMTDGAAGMDLCSDDEETWLYTGDAMKFRTGIALAIPPGFEGQIRPRSGLAKIGVTIPNAPGTVDSDYRGEVCVLLVNTGEEARIIERGDRIAQLVIAPVVRAELVEVDALDETARGAGGFGSTGTKQGLEPTTNERKTMSEFKKYRRKQIAELRTWEPGDDMTGVSVSSEDTKAGSPKSGDMIARNPKNHADQWLVAAAYFADNFEPAA